MENPDFKKLFQTEESKFVRKALDFYDGNQLSYVIQTLSDKNFGRRDWQEKGMRPMYRNITNMIVQKSGLLFINGKPNIQIYTTDVENPDINQTAYLNGIYDEVYWHEFMINLDSITRLIKTTFVLQQFNPNTNSIIFDILHKGNCYLRVEPITNTPTYMVYIVSQNDNETYYREFDNNIIKDWVCIIDKFGNEKYELLNTQPNPYNTIPITVCYDTNLPRTGIFVDIPKDLVLLNEAYNMQLTDLEYASSWVIHQTLFTNCEILNQVQDSVNTVQEWNSLLPRQRVQTSGVVGGLGSIVHIDTQGVENPFVEYKGPQFDLTGPQSLFNTWIKDFAYDWSVRVKIAGDGTANSGFQLVVEEMDNLELRKQRQRMFEISIERMVKLTASIWNTHFPNTFSPELDIDVEFTDPKLPYDTKEQEEIWKMKLEARLLTPIDYYQYVMGYDYDDAVLKWEEVTQFYLTNNIPLTDLETVTTTEEREDQVESQVDQIITET